MNKFPVSMKHLSIVLFLLFPVLVQAQSVLKGTAYDADKRSKLNLVFAHNLTQQEADHSGQKGDFEVMAEVGDLIVFSCPGYLNDTLIVEDMSPKMVLLRPALIVLNQVVVSAKGASENIRETYASAYSSANTTVFSKDGSVSLYNAFSKQAQQKRAFQKFMEDELNEKEIDRKFNPELVSSITKVRGQVLEDFMSYYRPTYSQVEAMSDVELRTYIIQSYNEYIKLPAEARIYPPLPPTSFGAGR